MTTTRAVASAPRADMPKTIYRLLDGGDASDVLLHGRVRPRLARRVHGTRVLDVGIGRGFFTDLLLQEGPAQLVATDYDPTSLDRTKAKLLAKLHDRPAVDLEFRTLDLTGDVAAQLGYAKFEEIYCLSVLMHLGPEAAVSAVRQLLGSLEVGGRLTIGVIDSRLARGFYIPSSRPNWYYPRLKGVPAGATELDVPAGAEILLEHYPEDPEFYEKACDVDGFEQSPVLHLTIGSECDGTIYAERRNETLWRIHEVQRVA